MSHEDGGTYVMDRDGSFQFLKGYSAHPVGSEIEFRVAPRISYLKIAAAAACLLLAVGAGAFTWMWRSVSFFLYLDINPSIELRLNRFERVVSAQALNEDGQLLLEDVQAKGRCDNVVGLLVDAAQKQGYLPTNSGGEDLHVTLSARKDKNLESLAQNLSLALTQMGLEGTPVDTCTETERAKASELGISPGKLKLAQTLLTFDLAADLEAVSQLPVGEINRRIHLLESKGSATEEEPNHGSPQKTQDTGSSESSQESDLSGNASDNGNGNSENENSNSGSPGGSNSGNGNSDSENSNSGSPGGSNSGNGDGENENSNSGSPGGSNSGNGDSESENSNSGSPGGSNSGNGDSDSENSNSGSPGGSNSGNGNGPDSNSGTPGGSNSGNGNGPDSNSGSPGGSNSGNGNGPDSNSGTPGGSNSGNGPGSNSGTPGGSNSGNGNNK